MAQTSRAGSGRIGTAGRESRGRTPAVLDLPAIAAVIIPLLAARSALRVQLGKPHNMLLDARDVFTAVQYWWLAWFPAGMILVSVLCVNFIGDGLRDAFDPSTKRGR